MCHAHGIIAIGGQPSIPFKAFPKKAMQMLEHSSFLDKEIYPNRSSLHSLITIVTLCDATFVILEVLHWLQPQGFKSQSSFVQMIATFSWFQQPEGVRIHLS